jgi:hypothetical protein
MTGEQTKRSHSRRYAYKSDLALFFNVNSVGMSVVASFSASLAAGLSLA